MKMYPSWCPIYENICERPKLAWGFLILGNVRVTSECTCLNSTNDRKLILMKDGTAAQTLIGH